MAFTLQEIDEKIKEYTETREKIETKLKSLLENPEFKKMQNGTDSVEVQDITDTIEALISYKNDCDNEIAKLENMKLSICQKKSMRSKLKSDFYGY